MEDYRGRQGWRQWQLDTVASVSADTRRTGVRSQRAKWAKVCQTCIDVWESYLRRADGHHCEGLMTVSVGGKLYKYLSARQHENRQTFTFQKRKPRNFWS